MGKLYEPRFMDMAKSDQATFFTCDIDAAPQVAYDCEVTDVPSVSVLPLGMRPDGTQYDKTDLVTTSPNADLQYDKVFSEAKTAMDSYKVEEAKEPRAPWNFDPATGTTLPRHSS